MTTSGTYSFTVTRDDIIREAMLNIGKLGEAEVPTAQETTDCARKLNMLVKQWMGKADFAPGLKMWTRRHGDLFLSNATGQYNLGPTGDNWTNQSYQRQTTATAAAAATSIQAPISNVNASDYIGIVLDSGALFWTTVSGAPSGSTITLSAGLPSQASSGAFVFNYTTKAQIPIEIETVVLRYNNGNDVPLGIMTVQEYDALPLKSSTTYVGDPNAIYYEPQLSNGVLYTDVGAAADVTKRLHMTWLEPIQDFNNPTDNPEFPQEWFLPLSGGLSKQIAPMFRAVWDQLMEENYKESLSIARALYAETSSLHFEPGNDDGSWHSGPRR